MDATEIFRQLAVSVGLGLLIGLQRERTDSIMAGIRTFPLITVLGTVCGLLGDAFGGWVIGFGLAAMAGVIVVGNLAKLKRRDVDPGVTTEVTMLLMYCLGAFLVVGPMSAAIVLTGAVVILLHLKPQMHAFAARLGDDDFKSIMTFVVISLVILPVLPNQAYGPYQVLNPYKIWLMVVLIVGMSLAGYVLYKAFGERVGTLVGGILGGLISSTATTVSYARRARQEPEAAPNAAQVIMIASTIVFLRVLVILAAVVPTILPRVWLPLGTMFVVLAILSFLTFRGKAAQQSRMPEHSNPTELRFALGFAALFSIVLLATAAAQDKFGARGLWVVAGLSGLTDMDAITLSTAQMIDAGKVSPADAWRAILLAAMANLIFKAGVVAALGPRALVRRITALFGISLLAGGLILIAWPKPAPEKTGGAPSPDTRSTVKHHERMGSAGASPHLGYAIFRNAPPMLSTPH